MEIRAHFSQIRGTILAELNASKTNVTAAIAWLTDPELFNALVRAARRGVLVRIALLDDTINRGANLRRENLIAAKGQCYWIPDTGKSEGSLHHKFCVIDHHIVITGSYNWTRRASSADENIIVLDGDEKLAEGYTQAFEYLLQKYGYGITIPAIDTKQLQKRLEVILNLILLEDYELITQQLGHLKSVYAYHRMPELLEEIEQKNWDAAAQVLRDLLTKGTALIHYESAEIVELRLSLRTLEVQIIALSAEQFETEQLIDQFSKRQNHAIGEILAVYLKLRTLVLSKRARQSGIKEDKHAFEQAKQEHESYQECYDPNEVLSPIDNLTAEQQNELKRLVRKARVLCHPDRVSESDKLQAQIIFNQVQQYYRNADITGLRRLYKSLKEGQPFTDFSEIPMEVAQLRQQVTRLRLEVDRYLAVINELRLTETFKTLSSHLDWESYFAEAKQQLEIECAKLRTELNQLGEDTL